MIGQTDIAGRKTARVGFGCGRLVGGAGAAASRKLVETARTLGITHFDVAPSYGLGLAENVLGDVLSGDPAVTIATKVGIGRPSNPGVKALARQILRPLLAATPGLKARLARGATTGSARQRFGADEIEASLADSLRRLKRDSVDALLLHEPDAGSITDALGETMQTILSDGRARAIGAGTGGEADTLPRFGGVAQYRWNPAAISTPVPPEVLILHGVMRQMSAQRSVATEALLRQIGDPADPAALPGLLMTLALARAPGAIVLVSTNTPARLIEMMGGIDWEIANGGKPELLAAFPDGRGARE